MARVDLDLMEYANDAAAEAAYASNNLKTITIQPANGAGKSVMAASWSPTTNWGNDVNVSIGWRPVNGWVGRGYFEFDLSTIPAGAIITSAVLSVYTNTTPEDLTATTQWNLHKVTSSWSESTLTWNNPPTNDSSIITNLNVVGKQFQYYAFTITALVQSWLNGSVSNYGVLIKANNEAAGCMNYVTSDDNASNTPKLVVTYYTPKALSEATIKVEGSYALKGLAFATDSLNKTLTRTVSPTIDLSNKDFIGIYMRASRTGANIKIGFHDSGGTTTEITPTIIVANTWELKILDLSAVANANKDVIDSIIVTIVNADADNTFYIDCIYSDTFQNFMKRARKDRLNFSGISLG